MGDVIGAQTKSLRCISKLGQEKETGVGDKSMQVKFPPKNTRPWVDFDEEFRKAYGLNDEKSEASQANGDLSAPPPFKIGEIRAAIPAHCWVKDAWKSLSYVLRDIVIIFGLFALANYMDNMIFYPLYWIAQGTMFWAVFVLGHDCGHGSFSDSVTLNNVVGHILHSAILVPYHGWRISHRTHHANHGNVERDESWVPLPETLYKKLESSTKYLRYKIPFPLFAYPIYLWWRSPGKSGSHFNPYSDLFQPNERKQVLTSTICWFTTYSDLFQPNERKQVLTSTICWFTMLGFLIGLSFVVGPLQVLNLYGIPYMVFVVWLDMVTYLHHHGHEDKLPWYRGKEWSYLRGGLTTVDRDYGVFNNIHHDIGTHVIHHLFPQIPHYHLIEATKEAKPLLGKYYREPKTSGILPMHLITDLTRSINQDHFVSDVDDVVFYQTDPQISGTSRTKLD